MSNKHLAVIRRYHAHGMHVNVNVAHAEYKTRLGINGRIATVLTRVYGSMLFVYALVLLLAGWMLWQSYFDAKPFDPFPFVFLLFIGNIIQLLGGPIIQVGQNLSQAHAELRAEADFHVDQDNAERVQEIQLALKEILKQIKEKGEA